MSERLDTSNQFDLRILFDKVYEILTTEIRFSVLFNGHYYSASLWQCMIAMICIWAFIKLYYRITE